MIGYQIAFDLYESATQHFLRKVQETIRGSLPAPPTAPPTTADANGATPASSATTEESTQDVGVPVQESGKIGLRLCDWLFQKAGISLACLVNSGNPLPIEAIQTSYLIIAFVEMTIFHPDSHG